MNRSQRRSAGRNRNADELGLCQAPIGSCLLSGAICRLNAVKQTKSHAHQIAKSDRPAISTGISNFTRVRESRSLISRRNRNESANRNQSTMKSSRYVNEPSPKRSSSVQIGSKKFVAISIAKIRL